MVCGIASEEILSKWMAARCVIFWRCGLLPCGLKSKGCRTSSSGQSQAEMRQFAGLRSRQSLIQFFFPPVYLSFVSAVELHPMYCECMKNPRIFLFTNIYPKGIYIYISYLFPTAASRPLAPLLSRTSGPQMM